MLKCSDSSYSIPAAGASSAFSSAAPLTVDDIASKLELSASGVRAQITAMERDGVVRRRRQETGNHETVTSVRADA